jgi:hypothetical protein
VRIHQQNPPAGSRLISLRFLAHLQPDLTAFWTTGYRENCFVHTQAKVTRQPWGPQLGGMPKPTQPITEGCQSIAEEDLWPHKH